MSAVTWLRTQVTEKREFERLLTAFFAGTRPLELKTGLVEESAGTLVNPGAEGAWGHPL